MPKRMISDAICTSESCASLSFGAELLHYHLITQVDDYGRFFANTELVRAACFPLRLDAITSEMVVGWLAELVAVGTIQIYTVAGRNYLAYINWLDYNRPRAEASKFPEPPAAVANPATHVAAEHMQTHDSMCAHLQTSASICEHLRADVAVAVDESVVEAVAESGVEAAAESGPPPAPAADPTPAARRNHREFWGAFERDIGLLSKTITDDAGALLDDLDRSGAPAEWATQAIAEAVAQNKRSWAYVRAILERCLKDKKPPGTRPVRAGNAQASGVIRLPPAQQAARMVEEARRG